MLPVFECSVLDASFAVEGGIEHHPVVALTYFSKVHSFNRYLSASYEPNTVTRRPEKKLMPFRGLSSKFFVFQ